MHDWCTPSLKGRASRQFLNAFLKIPVVGTSLTPRPPFGAAARTPIVRRMAEVHALNDFHYSTAMERGMGAAVRAMAQGPTRAAVQGR